MFADDPGRRSSHGFCRNDKLLLFQADYLSAHQTRHTGPSGKGIRHNDRTQTTLHNGHQKDYNDQVRNTADNLKNTHHNRIHRSAEISGNTSVDNAYKTVDQSYGNRHGQRNPCPVPDSGKDIASQCVCSENMHLPGNGIRCHNRLILESYILLVIAKRTYHRQENRPQNNQP